MNNQTMFQIWTPAVFVYYVFQFGIYNDILVQIYVNMQFLFNEIFMEYIEIS